MKKKMWYDKEEDVLGVRIGDEDYWKSIELPNGIIIDVSKKGSIIGIEILRASKVFPEMLERLSRWRALREEGKKRKYESKRTKVKSIFSFLTLDFNFCAVVSYS